MSDTENRERARAWVHTVLQDHYEEELIDMLLAVVRAKGHQLGYVGEQASRVPEAPR